MASCTQETYYLSNGIIMPIRKAAQVYGFQTSKLRSVFHMDNSELVGWLKELNENFGIRVREDYDRR